jgi:ABC-type transport system involved in cytochrome c biogenesis permease subunit
MSDFLGRITVLCFGASYAVAFLLELFQQIRPRPVQRLLSLLFGGAGLFAHSVYLLVHPLPLSSPSGSLLFLGWILAIFYLYGSLHHRQLAWGLFVLPLVLVLTVLSAIVPGAVSSSGQGMFDKLVSFLQGERFWGRMHGGLVILAAVGVCVSFVASLMYLVQVHRLRAKVSPGRGMRLLSLERLEEMYRRAIILAFPLLTAGLLVGLALMFHGSETPQDWTSPKVVSTIGLWLVFVILLYLRYGAQVRGRRLALLTFLAFALLLFTLVSAHPTVAGGGP